MIILISMLSIFGCNNGYQLKERVKITETELNIIEAIKCSDRYKLKDRYCYMRLKIKKEKY